MHRGRMLPQRTRKRCGAPITRGAALGLLITPVLPRTPQHVIVRQSQGVGPRFPPVLHDQTPSYDHP